MTTPPDDAAREREWQAQEQALHQELDGTAATQASAHVLGYRVVVRALRAPPAVDLPEHFARDLARRVAQAPPRASARFEQAIAIAALVLFALGFVLCGGNARPALAQALGSMAASWPLTLLACLGLSALAQRRRPLAR